MTTDVASRVSQLVEPLIKAHGADLYDVVHGGATLQVLVGGDVDLDDLAVLTREISVVLDDADPLPDRYTLEVSTPGLERTLRTPQHHKGAIGERVKLKVKQPGPGGRGSGEHEARRLEGVITEADDDGFVVDTGTELRRLSYSDVERARTVFVWETTPKKGQAKQ